VLLVLGGTVVALLLLEVGMRAAGRILLWLQERGNRPQALDSDRRTIGILCIGESTTAMGGSPGAMGDPVDSYPRQLERILNADSPTARVHVVNKGVPGTNTTAILRDLPTWIAQHRPQIVIAMVGANDPDLALGLDAPPWWQELRTYKALRFAIREITGTDDAADASDLIDRHRRKTERLRRAVDAGDVAAALELGTLALADARLDEARRLLEDARNTPSTRDAAELGLACAYQQTADAAGAARVLGAAAARHEWTVEREHELAERYCDLFSDANRGITSASIAALPGDRVVSRLFATAGFETMDAWERAGHTEASRVLLALLDELPRGLDPAYHAGRAAHVALAAGDWTGFERHLERAHAMRAASVKPMTRRTYPALLRLLRQHGIRLVAVQYPLRSVAAVRALLDDASDVVFVDTEPAFKDALRERSYADLFFDAFGGEFGHATTLGNEILAERVAQAVRPLLRPSGSAGGAAR